MSPQTLTDDGQVLRRPNTQHLHPLKSSHIYQIEGQYNPIRQFEYKNGICLIVIDSPDVKSKTALRSSCLPLT